MGQHGLSMLAYLENLRVADRNGELIDLVRSFQNPDFISPEPMYQPGRAQARGLDLRRSLQSDARATAGGVKEGGWWLCDSVGPYWHRVAWLRRRFRKWGLLLRVGAVLRGLGQFSICRPRKARDVAEGRKTKSIDPV